MDSLLARLRKHPAGLHRSRSVRASLRDIGGRWRSHKPGLGDAFDRHSAVFATQVWGRRGDGDGAGAPGTWLPTSPGTHLPATPVMTRRKDAGKPRRKSGDIELLLKSQKHGKVDKLKLSELFSNRKYKSQSASELPVVPAGVPRKAAALLAGAGGKARTELVLRRRPADAGSGGRSNPGFVHSTPPPQRQPSKLQYGALLEGCGGDLACAPPAHPARRPPRTAPDPAPPPAPALLTIHLHALFAAVEHGHVDKARNILESTEVDVNSLNTDGLSALDVAVLVNHRQMARLLMDFGAKEGSQFKNAEALAAHLRKLTRDAEAGLLEATGGVSERGCRVDATRAAAGGAATTGCAGGAAAERDKQALHWERRLRALKRLWLGWQQCRAPPPPSPPALAVCGARAVSVTLPAADNSGIIVTKYKVEWSSRADFSNVCGWRAAGADEVRVQVCGLTRGRRYFFRVAAGNLRGWGGTTLSSPRSVVPSSWRDVAGGAARGASTAVATLDALSAAAARVRPSPPRAAPPRVSRKKAATIRQLFTAATKFQKNLRRGVYLSCVLYYEDRVLVTSEDFLPVMEVDETYPTCIYTDFHWLMKVACAWEDVKALRVDLERHTSPSLHFRRKLLTAAGQLQSALGVQDLGQLFHKPLRDCHGTVVLSLVSSARSAKAAAGLNGRWAPLGKLRRRVLSDDNTVAELLLASVHDQIAYHQVSRVQLPRGLYLGFLKLQAAVEVVRLVVPARCPAVPPHVRVRDNPHVSAEEWDYLKCQATNPAEEPSTNILSIPSSTCDKTPSESQEMFLDQIAAASRKLFKDMNISLETALTHRIYDLEVIELNSEVSLIMVCPPAELACSIPGQKEILLQRGDLLSLPIQAFEMIYLQTYHTNIVSKYSKLSCVLELDITLAAHSHREAFSATELHMAKDRLNKLEELQNNLNAVWKAERWLMDLICFAREKDKAASSGILLKNVLNKTPSDQDDQNEKDTNLKVDLLQIPSRDGKIKISPGRGSWPGPTGNGSHSNLHPEFSKSEQHLSLVPREASLSAINLSSQYLSAEINKYSRKSSADSQFSQSTISNNYLSSHSQYDIKSTGSHNSINNSRLPPSRSEDTLVIQNDSGSKKSQNNSTTMSTTSSPLLTVKCYYPGSMVSVKVKSNISESAQSLSSDSESQSCPINSSAPINNRSQSKHRACHVTTSKSMTSVKTDIDYTDTGQDLFVKSGHGKVDASAEGGTSIEVSDRAPKTDNMLKEEGQSKVSDEAFRVPDQPGILQVFAAYETGLAAGTSLKLHVTPRTSAREVIDLVVKQLNMAAVLKGRAGPVYGPERLREFCLVAVIGARERCLREDFRPLQLQNPWRKGRLFVRLKHDVLAALNHSAKQPSYI